MNIKNHIINSFSKELRLALLLCKPSSSVSDDSEIYRLIEKDFDWEQFIRICKWHRITPYIVEHIKNTNYDLPEMVVSFFKNQQRENALNALKIGNELIQIVTLFNENEINVRSIKGPVLAQELYGDINRRTYRDIDLIVPLSKIEEAHQVLINNNYVRTEPNIELTQKQKRYNYKRTHEYAYKHKENGVQVELHWRLFTNKYILSNEDYFKVNSKNVIVFKENIKTISLEDNLLYLACHGAHHLWFRLFWIKDFSVLIKSREIDWKKEVDSFRSQGMIAILVQAVFLSNILFSTEIPSEVAKCFKSMSLIKSSLKAIASSFKFYNNSGIRKFSILLYRLKLKRGFRYKIQSLSPFTTHYNDWKVLKLPDLLFFMYFPLRPLLLVYRMLFSN